MLKSMLEHSENEPPLDWYIRKGIASGSARGLVYMHDHCHPKIIHRNVNAANILLYEEFEPLVGNFENAILMDHRDTHVTAAVIGTIGHIAPEYFCSGEISDKTDVFSFGVMLLELITGQSVFDLPRLANNDDYIMNLHQIREFMEPKKLENFVDPNMHGNYDKNEVAHMIKIVLVCTQTSPMQRPKMSEIVYMLGGSYGLPEKLKEWKEEKLRSDIKNSGWILDSTDHIQAEILLSPR